VESRAALQQLLILQQAMAAEGFSCHNNNQPVAEATINAMLLAATYSSKARFFKATIN